MSKKITEALGGIERTGPSRIRFTVIQAGQGSSGNYTPEILEAAAKDKVFPRGTQSMADHDTGTDMMERPEGSIRNLVGVTLEDAVWEPNWVDPDTGNKGRLAADARISSAWAPFVDEFHEFIGASISAQAEINESGEIVRLLPDPFNRVDLVTVAGAGGSVSEVLEAARVIESRSIIATETTNWDVEMWLDAALRDRLAGDDDYGMFFSVDHDNEYVYYRYEDKYYRLPYEITGSQVQFTGDPVEVRRRTEYDPVITGANIDPADPLVDTTGIAAALEEAAGWIGGTKLKDSLPIPAGSNNKEGATMATIDNHELEALKEKAGRADELAAENKTLKEAQATQAAQARQARALEAVKTAFGDEAPKFYVTAAETAATNEDYDHDAFKSMVDEAAGHQAQEAGTPNLGGGAGTVTETKSPVTNDDIIATLEGRA